MPPAPRTDGPRALGIAAAKDNTDSMTRRAGGGAAAEPISVFISYTPADERWATWMAWELEAAGYRTMLQAWDFVPGTNFIDFMDRGVSEAGAVLAVLSQRYLNSTYGRMEWQAVLRAEPGNPASRLIPVRVEECPLDGLLATITYVDLVGVGDPLEARGLLLSRVGHALAGRAIPRQAPYPAAGAAPPRVIAGEAVPVVPPGAGPARGPGAGSTAGTGPAAGTGSAESGGPRTTMPAGPAMPEAPAMPAVPVVPPRRRAPASPPAYPPALPEQAQARDQITVLHVAGPRFGRGLAAAGEPQTATELQVRVWAEVTRLSAAGMPRPDLVVISGDLTESGSLREFEEALAFLSGVRALLGLEPHRIVIVPGAHDITQAACRAYFASCEADDIEPQPPFWPKWRHFASTFEEFYRGLDGPAFDSAQPWTLFEVPDLRVVVAGLNSTMACTHRQEDQFGWIGEAQAAWFAENLAAYERSGWLRIGVVRHDPAPGPAAAGLDRALLRDAGTLDRLLGPRLNLLVHGPGPGGEQADELASGLLVVPATGPGRYQVLRVTPTGVDRWGARDDGSDRPDRLEREWTAAGGTFPPALPEAGGPELGPGQFYADTPDGGGRNGDGPGPGRAESTAGLLLDRIAEVCETRHDGAKIRRVSGDMPHLLVTHADGEFIRQWRVGAVAGEPTRADLTAFLQLIRSGEPEPGSELVYEGAPPPRVLREEALRRGVRLRSFIEFQGLLDLRGYVTEQTARLGGDRLYPPALYVPQRFRELDRPEPAVRTDLADELLSQIASDHGRFVLVLGDFGRGKTFVLHELARRIPLELPHLIPLLIELRALDKAHTVDGLVAAHLANHGEHLIDLRAFRYMLRQGRVVLLFDGFDELVTRVTYERAAEHLETLVQAAQDKAKIVVTSRTQHFRSHEQVLTALGERVGSLHGRRVFSVEDFGPDQIRAFLAGRYGADTEAAARRLSLISGIHDLLGLSRNPRMLSFIADLDESRLRAVAGTGEAISAAGLYEEILDAWLAYEERRTQQVPGAPGGFKRADLWRAATTLALRLWEAGEAFLRLADITDVADTLSGLAGGRLSPDQRAHALGSGSLLVRTDEGLFGFIHPSVVEWLVAAEIARQLAAGGNPPPLSVRKLTQLTVDFMCDLAGTRECQAWAARVLADPAAGETARANAIRVSTRLRTPVHTDLRGALLSGEDLSYRELGGVDLTSADLTDTRLVGANLAGARLTGAKLAGARLDEARLTGADLSGADFSRARLARADLRGVTVTGSRWSRAALIDAVTDPGFTQAPELHGAAVAPPHPVEVEIAPAAIGVPYGFHFQTSRLPEPVAYSRDGTLLAAGSEDGSVLVCDTIAGLPVRTLHGHSGRVYAVAFGRTGNMLATGASDGTVRLWDPATGECTRVLTVHPDGVWPMVLSPDGKKLATGDADGMLRLWDTATGRLRVAVPGHTAPIYTLAFSPDGERLAAGDAAALRLYHCATGEAAAELSGHRGPIFRAAFSPDGTLLAAGDRAGGVKLWDPGTGRVRHDLAGHSGSVYTLAFSPDGTSLATGDTWGSLRLWDPLAGRPVTELPGHQAAVYWVTFSPAGDQLASCDSDGEVRLWDPATGQRNHVLSGHKASVWPIVFRPDGAQLATSGNDGTVRLWDPAGGTCRHMLRGHGRRVTEVRFSPSGDQLATSGSDGTVRLWQPQTGQQVRELSSAADRLISVIFSPRGDRLATTSNDGGVYLWNSATGDYERQMDVETDHVWAEAFHPEGNVLATANDDDTVRLWYATTGRHVSTLGEHRGRVRSIAFSPDGSLIATGCDDRMVRLWGSESRCWASLEGHTDRVYSVAFSPDGAILASASSDGTVRLWDASGTELGQPPLSCGQGRLWSAAWSPDGAVLATAGDEAAVKLWDWRTGDLLHTLAGHGRRVWSVAFSPAGDLLASASDDGTAKLWRLGGTGTGVASTGAGGAGAGGAATGGAGGGGTQGGAPGNSGSGGSGAPSLWLTLLGLPEGWAALSPDGRYKQEGDVSGQFWHVVGMCRFDGGELGSYLPAVRRIPLDAGF
jgi:WD40 repeat protein/3',5'-cyclic AMP phosphodiesterase CpdA